MTISTSELNINSEVLKLNDIPSGTTSNYLFYNSATKAVSQSPLSILATANGATYDYAGNVDVAVNSIDFDNLQITAPANGQVVIKQGYAYGGALTSSATADIWKLYILSNISADSTLTLPAGSAGDSIKIVNMSAFDSNGNYVAPSFTWTINPNGSEKIMRASNLVLDESTSSFELYYTDAANGWVINGIS